RIVDGAIYFDSSGFGVAPEGKRWFALDLHKLDGGSAASPFGSATPKSALDTLQRLAGSVETIGDETVAMHHATHYRASIDQPGIGSPPVDVWIDDADRIVKMHVSVGGTGTGMTMEVTAFGVPVDVVAPPTEEVGTLPYDLPGWGLLHD